MDAQSSSSADIFTALSKPSPQHTLFPAYSEHHPALLGNSPTGRSELVTQAFEGPRYALRSGNYKYIPNYGPRTRIDRIGRGEQLYDLSTDPAEEHNLAPQLPDKTAELRSILQNLTAESVH